jgi:hypothetical protein
VHFILEVRCGAPHPAPSLVSHPSFSSDSTLRYTSDAVISCGSAHSDQFVFDFKDRKASILPERANRPLHTCSPCDNLGALLFQQQAEHRLLRSFVSGELDGTAQERLREAWSSASKQPSEAFFLR